MNSIAARLKVLRADRAQAEVAQLLGIKQTAWSRYECGAAIPGAEMLLHICNTFSVSADWLLGLSDDRSPGSPSSNAPLLRQIHDLQLKVSTLQDALDRIGGLRVHPVKTGGSSATKTA